MTDKAKNLGQLAARNFAGRIREGGIEVMYADGEYKTALEGDDLRVIVNALESYDGGWPSDAFNVGQYVEKGSGEARYSGWIAARYRTRKGGIRYVIEVRPQGFQMIVTPQMIVAAEAPKDEP